MSGLVERVWRTRLAPQYADELSQSEVHSCPNCSSPAERSYCPNCGQEQGTLVPSFRVFVADAVDDLFSFNARLPRTLWALVFRPGELTNEWVRGRRARYVSPLRLYIWSAAIFFALWSLLPVETELVGGFLDGWLENEAALDRGALVHGLIENLPRAMVLLLPVFAVITWVSSLSLGRTYLEHLVFALHFHAFFYTAQILVIPLQLVGSGSGLVYVWAAWYLDESFGKVFGEKVGWRGIPIFISYLLLMIGLLAYVL